MILVTGGAGFIGTNFVFDWLQQSDETLLNVDKLTYASNLDTIKLLQDNPKYIFAQIDICDRVALDTLFVKHKPRAVLHFAAESHVDRSIHSPIDFVQTNVVGTFALLETIRSWWNTLNAADQAAFHFLHISTDEVFGSLNPADPRFSEMTPYAPNNPYSATKAASDHLVRAYHHTYGLPTLTTNCSNNYGPYQFPEKLIPLMIANALNNQPLPIYGDGQHVRDWLYVGDHCSAIRAVLTHGTSGKTYNISGQNEKKNLDVVYTLCDLLDELRPKTTGSYRNQIIYVKDRPGHDRRYATDAHRLKFEIGWEPIETFETGLAKTVRWYLDNPEWMNNIESSSKYLIRVGS